MTIGVTGRSRRRFRGKYPELILINTQTLSQLRLSSPLALLWAFPPNAVAILATEVSDVTVLTGQPAITLDLSESAVVADLAALYRDSRHCRS
jgi:hypothetical protein